MESTEREEALLAEIAEQRSRIEELKQAAAELERVKAAQAEAMALVELEQNFSRVLLENLSEGVVACDAEVNLKFFNRVSMEWHGVDIMQVPPEEWAKHYDLFEADGVTPLPVERIPLFRAIQGERVRDAGMAIVAKGRPMRHIVANGEPLFDAGGKKIGAVVVMHDVSDRKRAEEALRTLEEMIRAQAQSLADLSTPLIPISDEIVVMPLIGLVDALRMQQIMETLLRGVSTRGAKVAILDITGVPVVDSAVADGLLRAARAVRLLGAEAMITGIRAEVAQSLVHLGADLTGVTTCATLQSGIALAMRRR